MSLTIPSTFRTQIAQSIDAKDDGNCAERHQPTAFDQITDIVNRLLGPSAYQGVRMLNRAAEHCSDRAMIAATMPDGAQDCTDYAEACLFLQRQADALDAYLVASYLESEAN